MLVRSQTCTPNTFASLENLFCIGARFTVLWRAGYTSNVLLFGSTGPAGYIGDTYPTLPAGTTYVQCTPWLLQTKLKVAAIKTSTHIRCHNAVPMQSAVNQRGFLGFPKTGRWVIYSNNLLPPLPYPTPPYHIGGGGGGLAWPPNVFSIRVGTTRRDVVNRNRWYRLACNKKWANAYEKLTFDKKCEQSQ